MIAIVIFFYSASAALSLYGLIAPYVAARREAGFAERAQKEASRVSQLPHEEQQASMDEPFETSGRTLRAWVETYMFDGRSSEAHAARTAYKQMKHGLRPVAAGVLLGAIASLLSLTL